MGGEGHALLTKQPTHSTIAVPERVCRDALKELHVIAQGWPTKGGPPWVLFIKIISLKGRENLL